MKLCDRYCINKNDKYYSNNNKKNTVATNVTSTASINCYSNLISLKRGITYNLSHYFAKIKVDSYDSLPREKILTLHNVIIHIKSVLNKDKNPYYYKIFLEKCSYQLAKK